MRLILETLRYIIFRPQQLKVQLDSVVCNSLTNNMQFIQHSFAVYDTFSIEFFNWSYMSSHSHWQTFEFPPRIMIFWLRSIFCISGGNSNIYVGTSMLLYHTDKNRLRSSISVEYKDTNPWMISIIQPKNNLGNYVFWTVNMEGSSAVVIK